MKTRQFFTILTFGLAAMLVTLMLGSTFGSVQAYPSLNITPTPEKVQTSRNSLSRTVKTERLQTRLGTASLQTSSTGIANGDFESGRTGWEEYSLQGWPLIVHKDALPPRVTPHSGNWAAWLGGDNEEISYISQTVTIPRGITALRFWHWVGSQGQCGNDFAWVKGNYLPCEQGNRLMSEQSPQERKDIFLLLTTS